MMDGTTASTVLVMACFAGIIAAGIMLLMNLMK